MEEQLQAAETAGTEQNIAETAETVSQQTAPESVEGQEGVEQAEKPVFTPNLSYKVQGKEKKFADWLQGAITDSEKEKAIRELYEKADGLDIVKSGFDRTTKEYQTLQAEYNDVANTIGVLRSHLQHGDFDAFFSDLKIPKQAIQKWVLEDLQAAELPPEQRQARDARWNAVRQSSTLERENARLQQEIERYRAETEQNQLMQRQRELDSALSDSAVSSVMQEYDQRAGRIGAFRDEVIMYAAARNMATGNDMSVQEAVQGVLNLMGKAAGAGTISAGQVQAAQTKKPVIPNIQGSGVSPVKKSPKSVDELRTMFEQRYANRE